VLAAVGACIISVLYFVHLLEGIWTLTLLLFIFPYLSFSLLFSFMKKPEEKKAVDVIRKRYTT